MASPRATASTWAFLVPPLAITAADLFLRNSIIRAWDAVEHREYVLSVLSSFVFWFGAAQLLAAFLRKQSILGWGAATALSLLLATGLWVPFGVFFHYGKFPNRDIYLFLANQLEFSLRSTASVVTPRDLVLFITCFGVVFSTGFVTSLRANTVPGWLRALGFAGVVLHVLVIACVDLRPSIPLSAEGNSIRFVAQLVRWRGKPPPFFQFMERQVSSYMPAPDQKPRALNILFVVAETLGAHYLQPRPGQPNPAPALEEFSTSPGAVRLTKLHSNSSCTDLSLPSLLTGLNPTVPATRLLGAYLPFEVFKAYGFDTFLVSSHNLTWASLDRFLASSSIDYVSSAEKIVADASDDLGVPDGPQLDRALERMDLASRSGRRFFGVVHLNTTHPPYQIDEGFQPFSPSQPLEFPGAAFARYLNSIAQFDRGFGEFLHKLRTRSYFGNLLVVFTADHGEAFGQHGIISHCGKFYEEESWVPGFVYLSPPLLRDPELAERFAQLAANSDSFLANVDLFPTVLDLAGLPNIDLTPTLDGRSFARPLLADRLYTFSNCSEFRACPIPHFGVYFRGTKFLFHGDTKTWEAFDPVNDPLEKANLFSERRTVIAPLVPKLLESPTLRGLASELP